MLPKAKKALRAFLMFSVTDFDAERFHCHQTPKHLAADVVDMVFPGTLFDTSIYLKWIRKTKLVEHVYQDFSKHHVLPLMPKSNSRFKRIGSSMESNASQYCRDRGKADHALPTSKYLLSKNHHCTLSYISL